MFLFPFTTFFMQAFQRLRDSTRMGQFTMLDFAVAMGAGAYLTKDTCPYKGALLAIPVGIITHFLLGIKTPLNDALGLTNGPPDLS